MARVGLRFRHARQPLERRGGAGCASASRHGRGRRDKPGRVCDTGLSPPRGAVTRCPAREGRTAHWLGMPPQDPRIISPPHFNEAHHRPARRGPPAPRTLRPWTLLQPGVPRCTCCLGGCLGRPDRRSRGPLWRAPSCTRPHPGRSLTPGVLGFGVWGFVGKHCICQRGDQEPPPPHAPQTQGSTPGPAAAAASARGLGLPPHEGGSSSNSNRPAWRPAQPRVAECTLYAVWRPTPLQALSERAGYATGCELDGGARGAGF